MLKLVPTSKAIMLGACSFSVIAVFSSSKAWAQSSEYDIDPQPLEQALLLECAQPEGLFLLNDIDLSGFQSPSVFSSYNRDVALQSLLAATNDAYNSSHNGALRILSTGNGKRVVTATKSIDRNNNGGAIGAHYRGFETVVVTGTNIRGADNPITPVLKFDREDIDLSGAAALEDFLRTIPQNFNFKNVISAQSANPFSNGNNLTQSVGIDLRRAGGGLTLTLLNGRRLAALGPMAFVNIYLLPLGTIERVDVQIDGASAIYESDAIGSVMNFVIRTDSRGQETAKSYGLIPHRGQLF